MITVAIMGATGAVGTETVRFLVAMDEVGRLILLGRREFTNINHPKIEQHLVDVLDPESYAGHLTGAEVAICTLGVGQPSKVTKEDFLRIDRDAALAFGWACKEAGVQHFQLLSSVGADAESASFLLRAKGGLKRDCAGLVSSDSVFFIPA